MKTKIAVILISILFLLVLPTVALADTTSPDPITGTCPAQHHEDPAFPGQCLDDIALPPPAICNNFLECLIGVEVPGLGTKFPTEQGLPAKILTAFLPIILILAGFVTVIVIVVSGVQFITSGGNPEAAAAAKNRLLFALIGFIVIILSYAILQIVNRLFLGTGIV